MTVSRRRLALAALVVLVLAAHLPTRASALEDLDSFNFALGLRDFDPRKHQPHPPGYPVVIALGRIARPVVASVSGTSGAATDARALAVVSALSGALLAALAIGARSQALWLVAPMLTLAIIARRGIAASRASLAAAATFAAACALWLVPLIVASGGVGGYLHTLAAQAGEDFAGCGFWPIPDARMSRSSIPSAACGNGRATGPSTRLLSSAARDRTP